VIDSHGLSCTHVAIRTAGEWKRSGMDEHTDFILFRPQVLPVRQASPAALGRRFVVSEILPMYAWLSFLQASGAAREEPESPSTDPQPKQARDLLIACASEIPTGPEPAPRALTRAASPSYVAIRPSPADGPDTIDRQRRGRLRRNQHEFRRHTYRSGYRCSRRIAAGAVT